MPSALLYLLLPVPVALMAAGLVMEGRGLSRLRRRPRTRSAVPGGTRRDFFGDSLGTDVAGPLPAQRSSEPVLPVVDTPAPPAPVMRPRVVPDPPADAERAA